MFDINNYLETLDCPNCKKKKYKIVKKSNYTSINNLNDLVSIYKSSGDELLLDQLVECNECNFQYLNPRIKSEIIFIIPCLILLTSSNPILWILSAL